MSEARKKVIRERRNARAFTIGPFPDGTIRRYGKLRADGTRKIRILVVNA